ncbi:MAG: LamG domain-containing protein [Myxococcota bacterium]
MRTFRALLVALLLPAPLLAATSSKSVFSPMGGNGHNQTFDGRLYLVTQGGDPGGWYASVFRPERVVYDAEGFPQMDQGAFSSFTNIQPPVNAENALAICEPDADNSPFRCNDQNQPDGGAAYTCYDVYIFESDASGVTPNVLHRRHLLVRTDGPENNDAQVREAVWLEARQPVDAYMRGIEPTVTRDGKLLIYQGHPNNNGDIDILMYTYNENPCALTGWQAPKVITAMYNDATVRTRYRLGERAMRTTDGQVFASGAWLHGAYPWLFPNGDAVFFTAAPVPCRAQEDPPGCGPRRGALSVLGYPTNWGISHIDGAINPDTDQTVRLFFSSPGPGRFSQIPVTPGQDVWPMFGSNTSNYAELVLDDGLDGNYVGLWHLNEVVDIDGNMDHDRTPDNSGYFHTGTLQGGVALPLRNNGSLGKAAELNGTDGRILVGSSAALSPTNAITVEMMLRPDFPVDCDGNNNYRVILQKGPIGQGGYSLVFEEGESFQARVRAGGEHKSVWSNAQIPVGQWSHVAYTYDAASGQMAFFINGVETNRVTHAPGTLDTTLSQLSIGGPDNGGAFGCPDGNGGFHGAIDEVKISSVIRYGATVEPPDAGAGNAASTSSSAASSSSSSSAATSSSASASTASSSSGGVASSSSGGGTSSSSSGGTTGSTSTSSASTSSGSTSTASSTSSSGSSSGSPGCRDAGTEADGGTTTDEGSSCAEARVRTDAPPWGVFGLVLVGARLARARRNRR